MRDIPKEQNLSVCYLSMWKGSVLKLNAKVRVKPNNRSYTEFSTIHVHESVKIFIGFEVQRISKEVFKKKSHSLSNYF